MQFDHRHYEMLECQIRISLCVRLHISLKEMHLEQSGIAKH